MNKIIKYSLIILTIIFAIFSTIHAINRQNYYKDLIEENKRLKEELINKNNQINNLEIESKDWENDANEWFDNYIELSLTCGANE